MCRTGFGRSWHPLTVKVWAAFAAQSYPTMAAEALSKRRNGRFELWAGIKAEQKVPPPPQTPTGKGAPLGSEASWRSFAVSMAPHRPSALSEWLWPSQGHWPLAPEQRSSLPASEPTQRFLVSCSYFCLCPDQNQITIHNLRSGDLGRRYGAAARMAVFRAFGISCGQVFLSCVRRDWAKQDGGPKAGFVSGQASSIRSIAGLPNSTNPPGA